MDISAKIFGILLASVIFALSSASGLFLYFDLSMLQFLLIYSGLGSSCVLCFVAILALKEQKQQAQRLFSKPHRSHLTLTSRSSSAPHDLS